MKTFRSVRILCGIIQLHRKMLHKDYFYRLCVEYRKGDKKGNESKHNSEAREN